MRLTTPVACWSALAQSSLLTDSHCECVYYQDWHRTQPIRSSSVANFKPGVHRLPPPQASTNAVRESIFSNGSAEFQHTSRVNGDAAPGGTGATAKGLPFDEEAKLVYGVVLSLRNMVKKLSGR